MGVQDFANVPIFKDLDSIISAWVGIKGTWLMIMYPGPGLHRAGGGIRRGYIITRCTTIHNSRGREREREKKNQGNKNVGCCCG